MCFVHSAVVAELCLPSIQSSTMSLCLFWVGFGPCVVNGQVYCSMWGWGWLPARPMQVCVGGDIQLPGKTVPAAVEETSLQKSAELACCQQARVESIQAALVPIGFSASRLGAGGVEITGTYHLHCSWSSLPEILAPPVPAQKLVNKSPFCIPQEFFKLLLLCWISTELLVVLFLSRQGHIFLSSSGSPKAKSTDF